MEKMDFEEMLNAIPEQPRNQGSKINYKRVPEMFEKALDANIENIKKSINTMSEKHAK